MRNTDRAMSNIESLPEGHNMLRRLYENIQEVCVPAAGAWGWKGASCVTLKNGVGSDQHPGFVCEGTAMRLLSYALPLPRSWPAQNCVFLRRSLIPSAGYLPS